MQLHRQVPVIDCHNDSLQAVLQGDPRYNPLRHRPAKPRRLWQRGESGHWDFPRALEAGQTGQMTNLLVPWRKDGTYIKSILKAYRHLELDLVAAPSMALLATTAADIERAHRERKVAVLLTIEGGEGIEGDLDLLHVYHQLGVRSMGLTWMYRNAIAEGNWEDTGAGLSNFGRQVVSEMNQLHMLVDVAHATERTFWDTLETSTATVICSHTSCRALVKDFHTHVPSRYLSDEQMKALAAQGGVLGIFFSANRELDDDTADATALARFIAHAASLCGVEHVGLGSDFDGGFPPHGLEDIRGLPNLTSALIDLGFTDAELRGILGGNWLRVFREVLGG
ncbi:MAG: membrane dipeptidase [Acidimicrobiia bacterium]|nr:membrane dipeptidase [Acidimicrobiia bacterium]